MAIISILTFSRKFSKSGPMGFETVFMGYEYKKENPRAAARGFQ